MNTVGERTLAESDGGIGKNFKWFSRRNQEESFGSRGDKKLTI